MVVKLNEIDFRDLEARVRRENVPYFLFCIVIRSNVKIEYQGLHNARSLGFNARKYHELVNGLDKKNTVVVEWIDETKGYKWHLLIRTSKPESMRKAIRSDYDK